MKKFCISLYAVFFVSAASAQSFVNLNTNQVNAGFNAAGDLFYNINTGSNFTTAGSLSIVFSMGNLWIGGLDANNQLHVAAQTYRQGGADFWPGPLDTITASCDSSNAGYNQVWKLRCAEVDSFVAFSEDPAVDPNYQVPLDIQTWPGNGIPNQASVIAPFVDVDNDGVYTWQNGDYPVAYGTQSLFYVYNDRCGLHTESGGQPLGLEIRAIPYAFNYPWDNALMNSIFIHYTIINRSATTYYSTRVGFWSDFDFASGTNHVGSDSLLQACYSYSPQDAIGTVFLNTPMAGCIAYENNFQATGNPAAPTDFYNYLQQTWKDGTPLSYGGGGYGGNSTTPWIFTGDPANSSGWNDPGFSDRRPLGTTSGFTFLPGMSYTLDLALVFVHDTSLPFAAVTTMKQYIQQVKNFYAGQSPICDPHVTGTPGNGSLGTAAVFPNPASASVTLRVPSLQPQTYSLYSSTGQLLSAGATEGKETRIDVSMLPAGLYFIQTGETVIRFAKAE